MPDIATNESIETNENVNITSSMDEENKTKKRGEPGTNLFSRQNFPNIFLTIFFFSFFFIFMIIIYYYYNYQFFVLVFF